MQTTLPIRLTFAICLFSLLLCACSDADSAKKGGGAKPQAVRATETRSGSVDVYIRALGTVTPPKTVTVKSRVDGQLMAFHFEEGQEVQEGDLLAEIDPRPFEVQLRQAKGSLAKSNAQLRSAEQDLARYRKLIKEQSVSAQQLQNQQGLVAQYRGDITSAQAAIADAELQLTYSRVTAPISGTVGLRKVDEGNMVRSSDSEGIVVITQMQPMHVIFTLVERQVPEVSKAMKAHPPLGVEAWSQDNTTLIATGELLTLDNQIDTATGTLKAKASFSNADNALFPNQFVNVRLKVSTLENVLIIPTASVQRNNDGFFVFVVKDGKTRTQNIKTGYATDLETVVESGLSAGDVVVTDGVDRLRDGIAVTYDPKQ